MNKLYLRENEEYIDLDDGNSRLLNFYYNTFIGRIFLKLITNKFVSRLYSYYTKSSFSKHKIKKYIKQYEIDLDDYKSKEYKCFNDFFIRQRKNNTFEKDKNIFISPCDAKLMAFDITKDLSLNIKNSKYLIKELINDEEVAKRYSNGICLVFRLALEDYHRYCYIDSGKQKNNIKIKGVLHTVRPIAQKRYKVFSENSREWTVLHTDNFGDIIQIEVGAILVGKIKNHTQNNKFQKGEEKGYFEYGGSTIILLIEDKKLLIDEDILKNSKKGIETKVKLGEKIGIKNCEGKIC